MPGPPTSLLERLPEDALQAVMNRLGNKNLARLGEANKSVQRSGLQLRSVFTPAESPLPDQLRNRERLLFPDPGPLTYMRRVGGNGGDARPIQTAATVLQVQTQIDPHCYDPMYSKAPPAYLVHNSW